MLKYIKAIFKIINFFNFINSYRRILLKVIFYEVFYSIKFNQFIPQMKVQGSKYRTDTIPCIFFFLHEISKFIKKNKINSIVDVGSGFGRIVNFISTYNDIKAHGIEYDNELYKKSLKIKQKKVKLYCGDIFKFNLEKFNSICFILNDPFKKIKDQNRFINKFKKLYKKKDKYFIAINFVKTKFPKDFKKVYSLIGGKKKSLNIYKIKGK